MSRQLTLKSCAVRGPQGPQGVQGEKGEKGDRGPAGALRLVATDLQATAYGVLRGVVDVDGEDILADFEAGVSITLEFTFDDVLYVLPLVAYNAHYGLMTFGLPALPAVIQHPIVANLELQGGIVEINLNLGEEG